MVQGMITACLTCDSFSSIDTWIFSLNQNYKFKNLLAKVEKVLTFLTFPFFNLEQMIHYWVISFQNFKN